MRLVLIVSVVGSVLLASPATRAAHGPTPAQQLLAVPWTRHSPSARTSALQRALHAFAGSHRLSRADPSARQSEPARRLTPLLHPADIDPNAFAAPLSDLTSGGAKVLSQGIEDNATAAGDALFLRFSNKTAAGLTAQGRQTGFGAQALLSSGQGILYVYFASIYATSAQATAAFARQKNDWAATDGAKELAAPPVGDPGQADSWAGSGTANGKQALVDELFFSRGRILLEDFVYLYAGDLTQYVQDAVKLQEEVAKSLDDVAVAQQPGATSEIGTPTPAPIRFKVNSVSAHKKGDDLSPLIHRAKAGKRVFVMVDWSLKSSSPGARPTYAFTAARAGHVVARDSFQGGLASYPPDEYVAYSSFKLVTPGKYMLTGRVTMSGRSSRARTSLTVVK